MVEQEISNLFVGVRFSLPAQKESQRVALGNGASAKFPNTPYRSPDCNLGRYDAFKRKNSKRKILIPPRGIRVIFLS